MKDKRAVALMYAQNSTAPRVVAKGAGFMAQVIEQRAKEHDIPVAIEPELVELLVQLDLNSLVQHFSTTHQFHQVPIIHNTYQDHVDHNKVELQPLYFLYLNET